MIESGQVWNLEFGILNPASLRALMRLLETQQRGTPRIASLRGIGAGLIVCALAASAMCAAQGAAPHLTVLEGKLLTTSGDCPVLQIREKDHPLSADTTYLFHTLEDKRLANREVRVEGTMKGDGTFEVERFFTVKEGRLYRVRYFCRTCNIVALEPGDCVCCQQPTELQEIPVTEDTK
jgi:hypothetical protein